MIFIKIIHKDHKRINVDIILLVVVIRQDIVGRYQQS
jgi:hypothetical protein